MRRLVAALACRVQGQRLYGKPLQNLAAGKTILDQILDNRVKELTRQRSGHALGNIGHHQVHLATKQVDL